LYEINCKTLNKEKDVDILCRLRDAVRRKGAEKCRTKSWVLLHDNAPAHRSVFIKDLLAMNNVTKLEHPLTWLQLIFTCPLPRKSALKGRHFHDATDIIKNAAEELKRY